MKSSGLKWRGNACPILKFVTQFVTRHVTRFVTVFIDITLNYMCLVNFCTLCEFRDRAPQVIWGYSSRFATGFDTNFVTHMLHINHSLSY